jgi:hypothetical protein
VCSLCHDAVFAHFTHCLLGPPGAEQGRGRRRAESLPTRRGSCRLSRRSRRNRHRPATGAGRCSSCAGAGARAAVPGRRCACRARGLHGQHRQLQRQRAVRLGFRGGRAGRQLELLRGFRWVGGRFAAAPPGRAGRAPPPLQPPCRPSSRAPRPPAHLPPVPLAACRHAPHAGLVSHRQRQVGVLALPNAMRGPSRCSQHVAHAALFPSPRDVNVTVVISNTSMEFTKLGSFGSAFQFGTNLVNSMDRWAVVQGQGRNPALAMLLAWPGPGWGVGGWEAPAGAGAGPRWRRQGAQRGGSLGCARPRQARRPRGRQPDKPAGQARPGQPPSQASHPATQPPSHPATQPPSHPATQPPSHPAGQPASYPGAARRPAAHALLHPQELHTEGKVAAQGARPDRAPGGRGGAL